MVDNYDHLIQNESMLDEVIRDLREALYRFPMEIPIWQSLGDAYMRNNQLQEALDAYSKAEELLR
ncbi:MAG: tetratricopeptide repeat protein, partial [Omnitrophica WOR_2 bacterium]